MANHNFPGPEAIVQTDGFSSSALDAGTSITAIMIYLLFGVIRTWDGPNWWGNSSIDTEHCIPGS